MAELLRSMIAKWYGRTLPSTMKDVVSLELTYIQKSTLMIHQAEHLVNAMFSRELTAAMIGTRLPTVLHSIHTKLNFGGIALEHTTWKMSNIST